MIFSFFSKSCFFLPERKEEKSYLMLCIFFFLLSFVFRKRKHCSVRKFCLPVSVDILHFRGHEYDLNVMKKYRYSKLFVCLIPIFFCISVCDTNFTIALLKNYISGFNKSSESVNLWHKLLLFRFLYKSTSISIVILHFSRLLRYLYLKSFTNMTFMDQTTS